MLKTEHKTYRLTPETVRQIAQLGRAWGVAGPVSPAAVIAECVRRAHSAQLGPKDPRRPARGRY